MGLDVAHNLCSWMEIYVNVIWLLMNAICASIKKSAVWMGIMRIDSAQNIWWVEIGLW